ncbi:MAG: helicase, partial [Clostridiales bacterium]|nr:helicase [Clostridiales bacterium]
MEKNPAVLAFENDRLAQTISLAKVQLEQAKRDNEGNRAELISLKQEMRENSTHSVSNLWNSQNFEDFVELSQYANPVLQKVTDYERVANRIAVLEKVISSPYFARIDFKFDDEEDFEKIYIGRFSLRSADTNEAFVYDWRAPIASMFYRFATGAAFYDAPAGRITGEIGLKRQYEIQNGKLEYFFDADIQIIDEFLRKLLSQNTSPKMRTIVETIQKEQDIVIRDMENDLMMVQGVAGSGKTSIALHRAAYLMYQGLSSALAANNIIIISPNALFEQYISNVLPDLGEARVASVIFDEMLAAILKNKRIQTKNQFLERLITNSRYQNVMRDSIEFKTSPQFLALLERFMDDLPHRGIEFEDLYYGERRVVSKEALREKVLSGRKTTPLGLRLEQLADFAFGLAREYYREYANQSEYVRIKKEIQKFTEIDVRQLYGKLFHDEAYFYQLAQNIPLPNGIAEILKFTRENLYSDTLYYDDAVALAFLRLKLYGANTY